MNHFHTQDLRKGRRSTVGQIYHVTTTTKAREPVFERFDLARGVVRSLRFADELGWVSSLAFVVMPDHLHWLFELLGDRSLPDVVKGVKQYSSRFAGVSIWQSGFHDRALRREDDILEAARYIVANPMRAGLVERIGDYPHWDAVWV
ncbi:REP-associated tyrosine transposase [Simiduia agarivorans]|uniref:Transposase IS200-like domain-containing protein n=1 Tax=Simiduia agarivorans (strain DSM 21679 / JCM 13881 / BCRC 17597 / SA1) TaxID=1117647 RepID=K4KHV5_SIMAS|nr:transposase [Simiduia agarivorans]AFU97765.1 hypothetical protein M5M_02740 [Simiduia agarivorans SA1 = DSM 21679]